MFSPLDPSGFVVKSHSPLDVEALEGLDTYCSKWTGICDADHRLRSGMGVTHPRSLFTRAVLPGANPPTRWAHQVKVRRAASKNRFWPPWRPEVCPFDPSGGNDCGGGADDCVRQDRLPQGGRRGRRQGEAAGCVAESFASKQRTAGPPTYRSTGRMLRGHRPTRCTPVGASGIEGLPMRRYLQCFVLAFSAG